MGESERVGEIPSLAKGTFPDTILEVDVELRITRVWRGGEMPCVGFLKPYRGMSLEEVFPTAFVAKVRSAFPLLKDDETEERAVDFKTKVGGCDLEVRLQGIGAEEGSEVLMLIREAEQACREEEYRQILDKVFEEATEAILLLPQDRQPARCNEPFCQLFGIECHEALGGSLEEYAAFFPEKTFEEILRTLENTDAYHGAVTVRRRDGSTLSAWLSVDRVYDRHNELIYHLMMLTDISELQESREMLRFTATHDSLTGLPNRRMLLGSIEKAVERSLRHGRSGAIFFIDLDNFKDINDSLGHIAGDGVLVECAARIKSVIRKSDIFGRLGGDEFLLITEEIKSPDALMHLAQKIIGVINKPFYIRDAKHQIGASIGITIFPNDSQDREALLQFADMAMYRAKEKGKNRYQFYSRRLDDRVRRHFQIEKALRYALENEGFYLVFQPQIDLSSEVVVGLEALLRIDERIAGPLEPKEFIPVAEESDLILKIGRWVFRKTCETLYRWRGKYSIDALQISINLSRRQLADDTWPDLVRHYLEKYHIDPGRIEFEITETSFMSSERTGYRNIRRLQELGCRISIDDFGTGYSSLATLKKFTVDKIKIDKSFIEDIAQNPTDRTIVKASIAMAQAMGLNTIAEGIESDDQKRVVKLMGCREMQGFLFSKPKRSHEILRMMEQQQKKGKKGS